MSNRRFKRVIRFYNVALNAEFSDGEDFDKLLIFFPPMGEIGGSMYNPIISSMFNRCYSERAYALRVDFSSDIPEKNAKTSVMEQHQARLEHMLLQATIAYEEGKSQFSITSQSLFNIWLVGASTGAWLAFQILKRRIEIQGVVMISPQEVDFKGEVCERTIPNTFYLYGSDEATTVEQHKRIIHNIQPEYSTMFNTTQHGMSDITRTVTDHVFQEIRSHNHIRSNQSNQQK